MPTTTAPARRSRSIAMASRGAMKSAKSRDPCVTRQPSTQILSLTTIGTPASGIVSPRCRRRSIVAASASERSVSTVTTALSACRGDASERASRTVSTADARLAETAAAISRAFIAASPRMSAAVPLKARMARPTKRRRGRRRSRWLKSDTGVANKPAYEAVSTAPVVSPMRSCGASRATSARNTPFQPLAVRPNAAPAHTVPICPAYRPKVRTWPRIRPFPARGRSEPIVRNLCASQGIPIRAVPTGRRLAHRQVRRRLRDGSSPSSRTPSVTK